jgi:hypothetical protein
VLLLINDSKYIERAEIIREMKGTNLQPFFLGVKSDGHTWVDLVCYLPSDLLVGYLYAQLEVREVIFSET